MLLKTRKFCLDKITKLKKLLTFRKRPPVDNYTRPALSYDEVKKQRRHYDFLKQQRQAISKSEFQLRLDNILKEHDAGMARWFRICDLFFQHSESYVDKKYAKTKKTPTKKSIFRKKDCEVAEPFIVEYEKPKITEEAKQKRIKQFLEDLYDKDQEFRRGIADLAADDMIGATKTDEIAFVDTWEKYLERTKKEADVDSFKTFLLNNQKFTKAQFKKFEISAIFHGKNLVNYDKFREEMDRVKSL